MPQRRQRARTIPRLPGRRRSPMLEACRRSSAWEWSGIVVGERTLQRATASCSSGSEESGGDGSSAAGSLAALRLCNNFVSSTIWALSARALPHDLIGAGPAVVLVHAGVADRAMWSDHLQPLAREGYRVLALDMPGFGDAPPVT